MIASKRSTNRPGRRFSAREAAPDKASAASGRAVGGALPGPVQRQEQWRPVRIESLPTTGDLPMRHYIAAAALSTMATGAFAQAVPAQDFVNQAASGGMFEVQSSQLALERAQVQKVRDFAQMMIEDHTAANERLLSVAEAEGLSVPLQVEGAPMERLQTVEATPVDQFDSVYVQEQVAAHEEAVALFRSYAENGEVQSLMAFAQETLPSLEGHLEMAQGLEAR
jgi:putative membrane protein